MQSDQTKLEDAARFEELVRVVLALSIQNHEARSKEKVVSRLWKDTTTCSLKGFKCFRRRHPSMGHWCGYIVIPQGHPWHGALPSSRAMSEVIVHGGVSWSHPGDEIGTWEIGFDCAHAGDIVPGHIVHFCPKDTSLKAFAEASVYGQATNFETYCDADFVDQELNKLAEQASLAESK